MPGTVPFWVVRAGPRCDRATTPRPAAEPGSRRVSPRAYRPARLVSPRALGVSVLFRRHPGPALERPVECAALRKTEQIRRFVDGTGGIGNEALGSRSER